MFENYIHPVLISPSPLHSIAEEHHIFTVLHEEILQQIAPESSSPEGNHIVLAFQVLFRQNLFTYRALCTVRLTQLHR